MSKRSWCPQTRIWQSCWFSIETTRRRQRAQQKAHPIAHLAVKASAHAQSTLPPQQKKPCQSKALEQSQAQGTKYNSVSVTFTHWVRRNFQGTLFCFEGEPAGDWGLQENTSTWMGPQKVRSRRMAHLMSEALLQSPEPSTAWPSARLSVWRQGDNLISAEKLGLQTFWELTLPPINMARAEDQLTLEWIPCQVPCWWESG